MGPIDTGKMKSPSGVGATHLDAGVRAESLGLPENMDLASLMTWLTTKMRDSDDAIRSRMGDMNSRKAIQNELNELMIAFRESRTGADQGNGEVAVVPPLDNPAAIRNSAWYKALDPTTRDQIDAMLNLVKPTGYVASGDITVKYPDGSEYAWKKGEVISPENVAKHGLTDDKVHKLAPRMHKDEFERVLQNLGDISKTAASNDEIEMIELQSAISARGQLLQLVSNMIASFHDSAKSIVGNIRG